MHYSKCITREILLLNHRTTAEIAKDDQTKSFRLPKNSTELQSIIRSVFNTMEYAGHSLKSICGCNDTYRFHTESGIVILDQHGREIAMPSHITNNTIAHAIYLEKAAF